MPSSFELAGGAHTSSRRIARPSLSFIPGMLAPGERFIMLKFLRAEIGHFAEMAEEAYLLGAACPRTLRGLIASPLYGAGVAYRYRGELLCRLAEMTLPAVKLEDVLELGDIKLVVFDFSEVDDLYAEKIAATIPPPEEVEQVSRAAGRAIKARIPAKNRALAADIRRKIAATVPRL